MDEMTFLRRVRSEAEDLSARTLDRGRADLLRSALAESAGGDAVRPGHLAGARSGSRRRIGLATVGMAGAAALVVALGIGIGQGHGGADAAAAAVLESAAVAALEASDPVLGPGQYLKVVTQSYYGSYQATVDGGMEVVHVVPETESLYIPSDRSADWVWIRGAEDASGSERLRSPGGVFYGSRWDDLDAVPRDPVLLRDVIIQEIGDSGPSRDAEMLVWIADRLRIGSVPADLRAAMYRVAVQIPGVTVTESALTIDGRTGVAIGRFEQTNGWQQDIIIDPATGAFIGERRWRPSAQSADDLNGTSVVTSTVVDSAPPGGTPNGYLDLRGCVLNPNDDPVTPDGRFLCPDDAAAN